MELVDFLKARLDEDEQIARRASEYAEAQWRLEEEFGETVLWWPPEPRIAEKEREHGLPVVSDHWRGQTIESNGPSIAPHIARHDPARVLREVEAKRRIVVAREKTPTEIEDPEFEEGTESALEYVLRLLALPYADHADYDANWKP